MNGIKTDIMCRSKLCQYLQVHWGYFKKFIPIRVLFSTASKNKNHILILCVIVLLNAKILMYYLHSVGLVFKNRILRFLPHYWRHL